MTAEQYTKAREIMEDVRLINTILSINEWSRMDEVTLQDLQALGLLDDVKILLERKKLELNKQFEEI